MVFTEDLGNCSFAVRTTSASNAGPADAPDSLSEHLTKPPATGWMKGGRTGRGGRGGGSPLLPTFRGLLFFFPFRLSCQFGPVPRASSPRCFLPLSLVHPRLAAAIRSLTRVPILRGVRFCLLLSPPLRSAPRPCSARPHFPAGSVSPPSPSPCHFFPIRFPVQRRATLAIMVA